MSELAHSQRQGICPVQGPVRLVNYEDNYWPKTGFFLSKFCTPVHHHGNFGTRCDPFQIRLCSSHQIQICSFTLCGLVQGTTFHSLKINTSDSVSTNCGDKKRLLSNGRFFKTFYFDVQQLAAIFPLPLTKNLFTASL